MAEVLAGRSVLVCGVGVAGASAARALLARQAVVSLCATSEGAAVAELVAAGATWLGALSELPAGVEVVVASPGLRPYDPLLVQAIRRTVRAAFDVPMSAGIELERRLGLGLQARRS